MTDSLKGRVGLDADRLARALAEVDPYRTMAPKGGGRLPVWSMLSGAEREMRMADARAIAAEYDRLSLQESSFETAEQPRTGKCPVCGTKLRDGRCFQERIAQNERPNPARYSYGSLADRPAVDAHLRAWGVIQ